jgi:hypothetical protein
MVLLMLVYEQHKVSKGLNKIFWALAAANDRAIFLKKFFSKFSKKPYMGFSMRGTQKTPPGV